MVEDIARRSHAVFMRAIDVPASERAAYLASECAGDAALHAKVESLLAAVDQSRGFLETPALGPRPGHAGRAEVPVERIGGYRLTRVIGVGGMATVYEAMQEQPRRRVALKVMRWGLERTSAVHRFRFESEVLARLRHPGIAQIFEAGTSDDGRGVPTPFFVMEYIADARPVTTFARDTAMPVSDRLAMLAEVCDAVQHGHQNGVIHRDLKPGNILVDGSGRPKVIDFGVARSSDPAGARITQHADLGTLIGTLNYMSPEQCSGAAVDARADVYALGIVLYELLCGRLPHNLATVPAPEAIRIVREERPPAPSRIDRTLAGDLEAIVMMAIEKEPERRYASAAALGADLRRFLRHEAIEARPVTVMYQCRLFARRNRALVGALAAVAATIVAGSVLSTVFALRTMEESRRRVAAENKAVRERDAALRHAYVANTSAAMSAFQSGEFRLMRTRLEAAPVPLRGWEWRFMSGLAERSLSVERIHEGMVFALAASPDGCRLATGASDGTLRVWNSDDRELAWGVETLGGIVHALDYTRDGGRVVSGSEDGILRMFDAMTGAPAGVVGAHAAPVLSIATGARGVIASASEDGVGRLWREREGRWLPTNIGDGEAVHGVAFSPDGERLATWSSTGEVCLRNTMGERLGPPFVFPGKVVCAAFSPDCSLLAAGGADGCTILWETATGRPLYTLRTVGNLSWVRTLAFSPDGRTLTTGFHDRAIIIWSMKDGAQLSRLRGHEETVSGLWMSPDGSRLFSTSWDGTMRVWGFEGGVPAGIIASLGGPEDRVIAARFAPDGSTLVTASVDKTVRIWDPDLRSQLGVLRGHADAVYGVDVSPDGRLIASASLDHSVRLWNATTGELVRPFIGHSDGVWSVAFDPAGATLASGGNDRIVRTWDVATARTERTLEGHSDRVTCVAYSPVGSMLASASRDHTVRLWNSSTGEPLAELKGHQLDVFSVVFSPDGSLLFSGSRDQTVRAWNTRTFKCERVMEGHGQFVTSLSLSASERRLAAGSWFGEVTLWDLDSLETVASFKGHDNVIRSVAFSPDARWLASASQDGTVRLYDTAPHAERTTRRERATAEFAAAGDAVERLFSQLETPERVVAALEAGGSVEPSLVPWVRKQILVRLRGPSVASDGAASAR